MSSIADAGVPATRFPYFQYTSLLGTHTILLAFTAVFLPATTVLITTLPPQQSSLDRPQHRLLEPITASPAWTLLWLCVGAGVCQAWWAGWMRQWWAVYPNCGGAASDGGKWTDKDSVVSRAGEGKVQALGNALANTMVVSALFHSIIIAFGAPITSHIAHTYLLSFLLSLLTIFVPSYTLSLPLISFPFFRKGNTDVQWLLLSSARQKPETAMERSLVYPIFGSVLGCWAGGFPIALDWDRPWQAWPLTPAYGALAGYLLASWSSLFVNVLLYLASQDNLRQTAAEGPSGHKHKKKRPKKKSE